MNTRTTFAALLLIGMAAPAFAQQQSVPDPTKAPCGDIKTAQPKIMVIPRVKEGEDIRKVIDSDINNRIAIAKVQEAFNDRGFTTVDFVGKLKAANETNVFNSTNVNDYKSQLLMFSGADIYTEVEFVWKPGSPNGSTVILSGYDIATGNNLGAKPGNSLNATPDVTLHIQAALKGITEDFLNTMQTKFTEMLEDGRPVNLTFMFQDGSMYNAESEIASAGDNEFQSVIEEWVSSKAVKGNYSAPRTSTNAVFFDDVRIPIRHPVTCKNFTTTNFGKEVYDYLKSLGIPSSRDVNGARVMLTIK